MIIKNFFKKRLAKYPKIYNLARLCYFYLLSYRNTSRPYRWRGGNFYCGEKCFFEKNKVVTEKEIAFVSILPPETSGIATTTFQIFNTTNSNIDVFSPFRNEENYYSNKVRFSLKGNSVYPLAWFFELFCIYKYKKIIIAVGGSVHNSYVVHFLNELYKYGISRRVVVYLHDVYIHNIFLSSGAYSLFKYVHLLNVAYKARKKYHKELDLPIFDQNVLGLRVLHKLFGITKFLVNSHAAEHLVSRDLYEIEGVKISRIFLPVFGFDSQPSSFVLKRERGIKYIGTFGIPGPAKKTELIIDAVNLLNKNGIKSKLILAGWGVADYCKQKDLSNIEYYDGLSDIQLFTLISQMDLAIQLRASNTGESSGCVPLTLEAKIPTIVSNVGSFSEYGNCVIYFDNSTAGELVELIKKWISAKNEVLKENIEFYLKKHTAKEFVSRLENLD